MLALIQSKISGEVYQILNMSRLVFGESRWPRGGTNGGGCHPPKNSTRSDFDEIWAIFVNLHKKNNEIGQNSLSVHVRGT